MRNVFVFFTFLFCILNNANSQGIEWVQNLSWGQILAKAKKENKAIFMDCFATWCQPCHRMDKEVYQDAGVGEVFNNNFIAVKVQMDKTDLDNDDVKKWYNDASIIQRNYSVSAFPTFLFFDPNGKPIHRAVGYKNSADFVSLAKDALNPEKQYYALLSNYKPGKLDTSELKGLARALRASGGSLAGRIATEYFVRIPMSQWGQEDNLSLMKDFASDTGMQKVAYSYLSGIPLETLSNTENIKLTNYFSSVFSIRKFVLGYLETLNTTGLLSRLQLLDLFSKYPDAKKIFSKFIANVKPDKMYTKDILISLGMFTQSSSDFGFKLFLKNSTKIDNIISSKGYSKAIIINILMKEIYDPFYAKSVKSGFDSMPWDSIYKDVSKKFGKEVAETIDIHVKSSLYKDLAESTGKFWGKYIDYYIEEKEKYGWDTSGPMHKFIDAQFINNFVFDAIFFHSSDKRQINIGLKWMEGVIRRNPGAANHIDTYANLLYKAGRRSEAIQWQQKAIKIASDEKEDWVLGALKNNLAKMESGTPTWIKEN